MIMGWVGLGLQGIPSSSFNRDHQKKKKTIIKLLIWNNFFPLVPSELNLGTPTSMLLNPYQLSLSLRGMVI